MFVNHLQAVAPNNEPLQLVVEVSDGQFHGVGVTFPEIEVRISLLDINDQIPMFTNLPASITVPEVGNTCGPWSVCVGGGC